MTAGLDDWGALTSQAAVVINGFAPVVILIGGLALLSIIAFFFIGWLRGKDLGSSGSAGSGAVMSGGGSGSSVAARAGRAASRRVKASGVRKPDQVRLKGASWRQESYLQSHVDGSPGFHGPNKVKTRRDGSTVSTYNLGD